MAFLLSSLALLLYTLHTMATDIVVLKTGGISLQVNTTSAALSASVDGKKWLTHGMDAGQAIWSLSLQMSGQGALTNGTDSYGGYHGVSFVYTHQGKEMLQTEIRAYMEGERVIFVQHFLQDLNSSNLPNPTPSNNCGGAVLNQTDQTGGHLLTKIQNVSSAAKCCALCLQDQACGTFVRDPNASICFLIHGATGTYPRSDREVGFVRDTPKPSTSGGDVIIGFPKFATTKMDSDLNCIVFGGCQLSETHIQRFTDGPAPGSETDGIPLVFYDENLRTLLLGPLDNFLISVHTPSQEQHGVKVLSAGIKASVKFIPAGFNHTIVLLGGHGINSTMYEFGSMLLSKTGKQRTDPYDSVNRKILGRLGYWTDNGAYYYHGHTGFDNHEEALKAVKQSFEMSKLPVRYYQWDDWWMYQKGDTKYGMEYWWPMPTEIPDGMTNWLNSPTSLYNPMYSATNVYINNPDYEWLIDETKNNTIPLGQKFYDDIFANGSKAQMAMFEQDFLCTTNTGTSLTKSDINHGKTWLVNMGKAADKANISLQFCMMNAVHTMASTWVPAVSNGRSTRDNTRRSRDLVLVLGLDALLHYAMGIFASRDNVFTMPYQPGCANGYNDCKEPNVLLQNTVAMLGGGPYGPSDKVNMTDTTLAMRSCRSDGVLLRPSKGVTMLDVAFKAGFDSVPMQGTTVGPSIWGAYSQINHYRFSQILSISLNESVDVEFTDLDPYSVSDDMFAVYAWNATTITKNDINVLGMKLTIPASPNPNANVLGYHHHRIHKVVPNGFTLLGEIEKFVAVSYRRFTNLVSNEQGLNVTVLAASNESVEVTLLTPQGELMQQTCSAGSCVGEDCDVPMLLSCSNNHCECK
eukprot:m.112767 g.112767  ORF g.112767 m.112767 type:complete len:859 (-) comp14102_c0_seq2:80-2656(-)